MREAILYEKMEGKKVSCRLCRHNCRIPNNSAGICRVRENIDGTLYSLFYARPLALASDPIEKKPLFHFLPSSDTFSIACAGCNFTCKFCQNWDISQYDKSLFSHPTPAEVAPELIAHMAKSKACLSVSYTYTEPTVFFEYALDCARKAKEAGLSNVFVTNGFMSREAIDEISPCLNAANVDLKAFSETTYRKIIGGRLAGVLDSIKYLREKNIWIEITTLVIPGMNDSKEQLSDIAKFIASIGSEIPWHVSAFTPRYKMDDRAPTPIAMLRLAYETGKEAGLKYVYVGNAFVEGSEDTICPSCSGAVIKRRGFSVTKNSLVKKNHCPDCGAVIDGIF